MLVYRINYLPTEDMVVLESTRRDEVGVGQKIVDVNVEIQLLPFTVVAACEKNVCHFV